MFNFEEKLKELETVKAEEIGSIVSEISEQFKEIYGEEISDKNVIKLMYYANAYHKSTRYTEGTPIPVLGVTRSGKSTFINSALGCKVLTVRGESKVQFENPITTVGDGLLSSTIYAECHSAPQHSKYCYIDTAGFLDTRGLVSAGITEYLGDKEFITNLSTLSLEICVNTALSSHYEKGMPALIVLVNYSELTGGASQSLAFTKILYSLLGDNEALSDRLILVVTHADGRRAELISDYNDAVECGEIDPKKQNRDDWIDYSIKSDIRKKYEATLRVMAEEGGFAAVLTNKISKKFDVALSSATGGSDSPQKNGTTVEEMKWFISLLDKASALEQIVIANFKKGKETKEAVEAIIGSISKKYGSGIGIDWFNFKSIYGQKEHVRCFSTLSEPLIQKSLKFFYYLKHIYAQHNDYITLFDNLGNQAAGALEYLESIRKANLTKFSAKIALLQQEKHFLKNQIAELDTEEPFEEHVFRELTQYIVLGNMRLNDIQRSCAVPGCFLYRDENNKEQLALINSQRLVVAQVDLSGLGAKLNDLYWPSLEEYVEVTGDRNRLPQIIRDEVVAKYKKILSKATGTSELLQNPFKEGEPVRFYILYGNHPSGSNKPSIQYSDPGFYIYHTADGKIMVNILHISLPHGIPSVFELSSVNHTRGNPKIPLPRLNQPQKNIFPQSLPEFVMDYAVSSLGKENHNRVYKALLGRNMPPLKEISRKRKHYQPCINKVFEDKRIRIFGNPSLSFSKYTFDIETNHRTIDDAFITNDDSDTYKRSLHIKSGVTFDLVNKDNKNLLDANNLYIKKEFLGKEPTYYLGFALNFDPQCKYSSLTWAPFRDDSRIAILNKVTAFNKLGPMNIQKIILEESILDEFTKDNSNALADRLNKLMHRSSKYVASYETKFLHDGYAEVYLYAKRKELPHVAKEIEAKKTRIKAINSEIVALKEKRQLWSDLSQNIDANLTSAKNEVESKARAQQEISAQLADIEKQWLLQLKKLAQFDYILKPFADIYLLLRISPNDNNRINEFIVSLDELRKNFLASSPLSMNNKSLDEAAKLPPQADASWYEDTKLRNLLNAAVGRENPNIDVLGPIPDNADFSSLNRVTDDYLYGKHDNPVKNKLFIPINLNNNHWVLITVIRSEKRIIYFDPLGNPIPKKLDTALKSDDCFPAFELLDMRLPLQKDGYNCGPWVVEFAQRMIAGTDINQKAQFRSQFRSIDITAAREQHNETLSGLPSQRSSRIDGSKINLSGRPVLPSTTQTKANLNTQTRPIGVFFSPHSENRDHPSPTSSREEHNGMHLKKEIMHQARPATVTPGLPPRDNAIRNEDAKVSQEDERWYEDTKLLELLRDAVGRENPNIDVLGPIPDNDDFSILNRIISQYLYGTHGNPVKNKLFIPINLNNNHWVLMTVTLDAREILYFDPLGRPIPEKLFIALKSKPFFAYFPVVNAQLALQKDDYNCGPWVVEFAKKMIEGVDIKEKAEFYKIDIAAAREQHTQTLSGLSSQNSSKVDGSKTNTKPPLLPSRAQTKASLNTQTRTRGDFFSPRRENRDHPSRTSSREEHNGMHLKNA